jgi:hypothetical protein
VLDYHTKNGATPMMLYVDERTLQLKTGDGIEVEKMLIAK